LVNGAAQENYLGLANAQINAIVQVVDGARLNGALCSGTFVAPAWVVTSRHCLQIVSPKVVVQGQAQTPWAILPVVASVAHPTEDVALLQVDLAAVDAGIADGGVFGVAPMQAGGASVRQLSPGDTVEMGGYGITETRATRSLRFLAESIVRVDPAVITVSGFGSSGACEGDSGGPLLVRGPDGSAVVAAVLSIGSATCLEEDTYVRLDSVQEWIRATIGSQAGGERQCGAITEQGRCLFGQALWCSASTLVAHVCTGATKCGWDPNRAGFGCVDPVADPCRGVDSVGACRDNEALRCRAGVLERETCGNCQTCRIDGKAANPYCAAGSAE
jgi:hypothetical protein